LAFSVELANKFLPLRRYAVGERKRVTISPRWIAALNHATFSLSELMIPLPHFSAGIAV